MNKFSTGRKALLVATSLNRKKNFKTFVHAKKRYEWIALLLFLLFIVSFVYCFLDVFIGYVREINPTLYRLCSLRKLYFHFLSHWMGYDRGDSFPFDFEPNGNPFGLNRKVSRHHDHIPFNVKENGNIVFSV